MDILFESSVIVAAERGQLDLEAIARRHASDNLAVPSVSVAEMLYGIRKRPIRFRSEAQAFLDKLLTQFPVIPFDHDAAVAHVTIRMDLDSRGLQIGHNDLQIAAIAVANGMAVAARDSDFDRIRGLTVLHW